jgi:hypothetical protein
LADRLFPQADVLVLSDRSEDVNGELVGVGIIDSDELDT